MSSGVEKILLRSRKADLLAHMEKYPESWLELVHLILDNKQPYAWRAAWVLQSSVGRSDSRLQKYIPDFIHVLSSRQDSEQRELLRILDLFKIDQDHEGLLFDNCMVIWKQIDKQSAVRFMALKQMVKLAKKYPELQEEIVLFSEARYMETLSPAIQKFALRLVNGISK